MALHQAPSQSVHHPVEAGDNSSIMSRLGLTTVTYLLLTVI